MGTVPRREPSRCLAIRDSARLRRAVPTGGLYLSGHHILIGGYLGKGRRRRMCISARPEPGGSLTMATAAGIGCSPNLIQPGVDSPRGKLIFPASGHETAPRPSAAAKAPGGPERSGGGAQRLAFVAVDGHDALLLPEAGKSRFLFSWALRCERHRRALPHQPVSRPAGSNQPEARVLNTYAGLCLDGSLAVIDAQ